MSLLEKGRASSPPSDLPSRVTALASVVEEERADFDTSGRLSDALFARLASLGLFRLFLPVALGGPELSALEFMDVVEAAAALDGSVGWLVGNGGGMGRVGAYLPTDSAREIFDDPLAFVVSSTATPGRAVRVPGGYRVTGRWPFGSGSTHGTWFSPVCVVHDGEQATGEIVFVYVPRHSVQLHDNWQVSGLCATGSVDFEIHDVFVPDRFAHGFQPEPTHPGTLYRLPTRAIFPWTVATVPLGILAGAVDDFVGMAGATGRSGDSAPLAEREIVRSNVGQVVARANASRSYLRDTMTALHHAVEAGDDLEAPQADFRLACTFASQSALWAIDLLTEMAGAVAIRRTCPLERRERDARAAAKHVAMSPAAYIAGGALMLAGRRPSST